MQLNYFIKSVVFIMAFTLLSVSATSQEFYYLTLDSAISIAKQKSYRMQQLKEDLNQARYLMQYQRRSYLPSLKFNGTLPDYGEALTEYSDGDTSYYYMKKTRNYYGRLQLSQKLPTDGTISANYYVSNTDYYKKTNSRYFYTQTKLIYEQPITSLFFYNSTTSEYKETKLNLELAEKQYKRNELDLIYSISSLFYNCLSANKQKEIGLQTLNKQQEAYKLAKSKFETGLIKEVEALQIEVDYGEAQNEYDTYMASYVQSANELKLALGLTFRDSIVLKDTINYKVVIIDENKAIEMGLQNRTEIREKQIQIKINELAVKLQRSKGLVNGSLEFYYDLLGYSSSGISYPYSSAFRTSMDNMLNKAGAYGVTFTLSVPIIDWGMNHSLVKKQKSVLKESTLALDYEKLSIENEIKNTISKINLNLKKLQLLEKNTKLSEKSYEISYLRFVNGDIDVETLGLDRIRYTNSQSSYLAAYINYKLLLLDLKRKTFFDYENNAPISFETE
jgi:outer membrane protein